MISILIPSYNYNVTELVKKLNSQAETLDIQYEIRILDDASSSEIIDTKFLDELDHVNYSKSNENLGRTQAREQLAQKAQFNTLLFLDADVMPQSNQFLLKYWKAKEDNDIVFGGITYDAKKPSSELILRWKYGKEREAKSVEHRNTMPYLSIISQSFLINKDVYLSTNPKEIKGYGLDVLFSNNLEAIKAKVLHIDNPAVHLGLENSESFIEKTKSGLVTLYQLEKNGDIPNDYRPIQQAYRRLGKVRLTGIFSGFIKNFEKGILKNLLSENPSLFYFDLYKLYHYCKLQKRDA